MIGRNAERGYTLIEIAIVLAIVGLVFGGILVGQSLIGSSQLRSVLTQIDRINSQVNVFRTRYSGYPGDLLETSALGYGLYDSTSSAIGLGNGDNLITDTAVTTPPGGLNAPVGETVMFWRQLSDAGLTDTPYGTDLLTLGQLNQNAAIPYFPAVKLNQGLYFIVGSSGGVNYLGLVGLASVTKGATGTAKYNMYKQLSPSQAYQIDSKLDDGIPNLGVVQARGIAASATVDGIFPALSATDAATWSTTNPANAAAGDCVSGGTAANNGTDTTDVYAIANTVAVNAMACNLRIKSGF